MLRLYAIFFTIPLAPTKEQPPGADTESKRFRRFIGPTRVPLRSNANNAALNLQQCTTSCTRYSFTNAHYAPPSSQTIMKILTRARIPTRAKTRVQGTRLQPDRVDEYNIITKRRVLFLRFI